MYKHREHSASAALVLRQDASGTHREPLHEGPGHRGLRGGCDAARLVESARAARHGVPHHFDRVAHSVHPTCTRCARTSVLALAQAGSSQTFIVLYPNLNAAFCYEYEYTVQYSESGEDKNVRFMLVFTRTQGRLCWAMECSSGSFCPPLGSSIDSSLSHALNFSRTSPRAFTVLCPCVRHFSYDADAHLLFIGLWH